MEDLSVDGRIFEYLLKKTQLDAQNREKPWAVSTIMKFRVPKRGCHTERYLKDNDDVADIRLAFDTTEGFVSNGTSCTEDKKRIYSEGTTDRT